MTNVQLKFALIPLVLFATLSLSFGPNWVSAHPGTDRDTLKFEPTEAHVQDVISHMLAAMGAENLKSVHDRSSVGTFTTMIQGKPAVGSVLLIEEAPNKRSDQLMLLDKTILHVIDGKHAWVSDTTGALKPLKGATLKDDLAQGIFNPELHLLDSGVQVLLIGTTNVDTIGKVYVLKVQFKGSYPELWYVAASNFSIIQRGHPVHGVILWTRYSDFRKVDGVTYPFRVVASGPENFTIQYDTIRHNIHPAESTFKAD